MRIEFDREGHRWVGVDEKRYADGEQGARGMSWKGVTRCEIFRASEGASFDLRYFEIAPGGYSRLEKHQHAHAIVVIRGHGEALIGDQVVSLQPFDAATVPPMTPHRWVNAGDEPFGFVCPAESPRDVPQPLSDDEIARLLSNEATRRIVELDS